MLVAPNEGPKGRISLDPITIKSLPQRLDPMGVESSISDTPDGTNNHSSGAGEQSLDHVKEFINAHDSSLISYESKILDLSTKQPSCPSSSNHSDYDSDKEDSEDSTHESPSADQESSASAVTDAENRANELLDRLMSKLQEWLEIRLRQHGTQDAEYTSGHGSTSAIGVLGQPGPSSWGIQIPKRRRSDSDDELSDDGGKEMDHNQKGGKPDNAIETRYVCPFFKHNRERYQTSQWKSCCWPGWVSTHRVKEHLYRRHMLPKFRCNRCRQDLKSSARLNEHQRADIICQRQSEEAEEEGIDEETEKLLRARKRKNGKARQVGEEEKWVEIYKILFPHDDPVPSPYPELCPVQPNQEGEHLGANVLNSFENFARREFSRRMRPRVESLVDGILEETLTSQTITDVANNVLQGIMESFRASQDQSNCQLETQGSPPRSPSPERMPFDSSSHAPQDNGDFYVEGSTFPDFDLDLSEILNCKDDGQRMDFTYWPTEVEALDAFQPMGV
ncbi:hypothetical protein ACHAPI_002995 [Fusarium lateritium]